MPLRGGDDESGVGAIDVGVDASGDHAWKAHLLQRHHVQRANVAWAGDNQADVYCTQKGLSPSVTYSVRSALASGTHTQIKTEIRPISGQAPSG
jgi:hypothetical protein